MPKPVLDIGSNRIYLTKLEPRSIVVLSNSERALRNGSGVKLIPYIGPDEDNEDSGLLATLESF